MENNLLSKEAQEGDRRIVCEGYFGIAGWVRRSLLGEVITRRIRNFRILVNHLGGGEGGILVWGWRRHLDLKQ